MNVHIDHENGVTQDLLIVSLDERYTHLIRDNVGQDWLYNGCCFVVTRPSLWEWFRLWLKIPKRAAPIQLFDNKEKSDVATRSRR